MITDPHNRHGGNLTTLAAASGRRPEEILDFSANINPLGFPDWLRPLASSLISGLIHYPDPGSRALVDAACARYGADAAEVICGNGTAEIISLLPAAAGFSNALIPSPTYVDYAQACEAAGVIPHTMAMAESEGFALNIHALAETLGADPFNGAALVFICRPNNPTGHTPEGETIRSLVKRYPGSLFIVDEAFGDFVDNFDSLSTRRPKNVVVLLSLTKSFSLPGLRMGLALADAEIAGAVAAKQPCWPVNLLAQASAERALGDTEFLARTRSLVAEERRTLFRELSAIDGLFVYPGDANFLFVRIDRPETDANILAAALLREHGIAVRVCDNYENLDSRFFRVAVRTSGDNRRLASALRQIFGHAERVHQPVKKKAKHTPAIMFQGTSSNAGKSILAAALCRILLDDGVRVAPFKAQNMSLNSFVTRDGGEMGRAQVVQAQAAKIEPDVRMNPVLLKPSSDTGSQVIVNGFPEGNMKAAAYVDYKEKAGAAARRAYDELSCEYDAVVLEGAGSPGEVNLKHHDIVNMAMARYAGSPVLIVGDIDRGGVFASFVGTMEVLAEWERRLVAGFVVNKFRGDASLLGDALDYTHRHTKRPVIGVVPYLEKLGLPEEDSVSLKERPSAKTGDPADCVRIGVVDLPHISNFTDFDPFACEDDVSLFFVRRPEELSGVDAVILPGSKNVMTDAAWLGESGLAGAIHAAAGSGKIEVVGICGGFQLIGKQINDPNRIESDGEAAFGLGLLDVETILAPGKTLTRTRARHLASGLSVTGYEIHHGVSRHGAAPLLETEDGRREGASSETGLTWGTYLHGIFDDDRFRRRFIDDLRSRKGLVPKNRVTGIYDLEPAFDRLAAAVRNHIDMNKIYAWMGL